MAPMHEVFRHSRTHDQVDLECGRKSHNHDKGEPSTSSDIHAATLGEAVRPGLLTDDTSAAASSDDTKFQLPAKKYGRVHRYLRYTLLSVYHRLNVLIVVGNIAAMIVLGSQNRLLDMDLSIMSTAVAANVLAAVIIRQELVINLLFILFGMCPQWLPLRVRRLAAKIYHLGGVHSGAAIAATLWFGLANYPVFASAPDDMTPIAHRAMLGITVLLDILLVAIIASSHPSCRSKLHNTWEAIHRFAGWTAVALFWALLFITVEANRWKTSPPIPMMHALIHNPVFWCLIIITASLTLPWLRLRKVAVMPEPLSDRAVRLHFKHTSMPHGTAPRFSDSPLREWHSFAGIPVQHGAGYSIFVAKAGDWTTKIISNPPERLWIRGFPCRGVLNVAPIFKRVVLIATGSGIGPILSLTYTKNVEKHILWSAPDPDKTFGKEISREVKSIDPQAVIIDTKRDGRPDLLERGYELYQTTGAEAVFIISNERLTEIIRYGLETRGVPVFAPIFDS